MTREIVFEFEGSPDEVDTQATELTEWFNESEGLYGKARSRTVGPATDEMGALTDAAIIIGSSAQVIAAFTTWLAERARSRRTCVRIIRHDGALSEVAASDPAEAEALEERLNRFLEQGEQDGEA